jgi:hypothetical protein
LGVRLPAGGHPPPGRTVVVVVVGVVGVGVVVVVAVAVGVAVGVVVVVIVVIVVGVDGVVGVAWKGVGEMVLTLEVGRCYYVRTARYDYVGRVVSIDGPYTLVLEDAAWVSNSGRLHVFVQNGRATGMEIEPVGVVGLQWLDWTPWDHPLFTEAV